MRLRVAWAATTTRLKGPAKRTVKRPKHGKPNTIILSADNDDEREFLYSIYRLACERMESDCKTPILLVDWEDPDD